MAKKDKTPITGIRLYKDLEKAILAQGDSNIYFDGLNDAKETVMFVVFIKFDQGRYKYELYEYIEPKDELKKILSCSLSQMHTKFELIQNIKQDCLRKYGFKEEEIVEMDETNLNILKSKVNDYALKYKNKQDSDFTYGAKYDNLVWLDKHKEEVQLHLNTVLTESLVNENKDAKYPNREQGEIKVKVPSFFGIPSEIYTELNDIIHFSEVDSILKPYYERIKAELKTTRIILRSSAVYSEDGETTGAGVYESVTLDQDTYESFKDCVMYIYDSVNSKDTIGYRELNNIAEKETIGIIAQIEGPSGSLPCSGGNHDGYKLGAGWANSIGKSRADTMKISMRGCSCTLKKDILLKFIADRKFTNMEDGRIWMSSEYTKFSEFANNPIYKSTRFDHYTQDPYIIECLAIVVTKLEELYGQPVQIEFGYDFFDRIIHLYQIRPLPKEWLIENKEDKKRQSLFENYDKKGYELMLEGDCSEICNIECEFKRDFTPGNASNPKMIKLNGIKESKSYITMLGNSFGLTMSSSDSIDKYLNHSACVIIKNKNISLSNGHLETRCLERDIPYIDNIENYSEENKLINNEKYRIVSDGVRGKVLRKKRD